MSDLKLSTNDRTSLIIQTALVCGLTSLSAGVYIFGDLSKKWSAQAYKLGATIDSYALDTLDLAIDVMQKYVWKEMKE